MQDEKSSKEAPFIMNTKWIAKEKIIASPEEHGELEWILLANSTRLSMDRTVSFWNFTFWIYASLEELSVHSTAIFLKAAGVESVHSQHRERDFSSSISRLFRGKFLMLALIEFRFPFCFFFFTILFRKDCFVRFFLLLA